ncbi:MAG: hypothetical protein IJZ03_08525 [Clostridia bacterium]|nr:hypothetical protein [Clostridia bacterium]
MNEKEKTVQQYVDEINRLSALLAERERADAEDSMFRELFPDVDRESIPDCVTAEANEKKMPLVAAYALYERRRTIAAEVAEIRNQSNSGKSSGPLGRSDNFGEALSIEQIRAMTPTQVRRHYKQILKTLSNQ